MSCQRISSELSLLECEGIQIMEEVWLGLVLQDIVISSHNFLKQFAISISMLYQAIPPAEWTSAMETQGPVRLGNPEVWQSISRGHSEDTECQAQGQVSEHGCRIGGRGKPVWVLFLGGTLRYHIKNFYNRDQNKLEREWV